MRRQWCFNDGDNGDRFFNSFEDDEFAEMYMAYFIENYDLPVGEVSTVDTSKYTFDIFVRKNSVIVTYEIRQIQFK